MVGGSDARQHQQLRAANRARAQDDLAPFDDEALAAAFDFYPDRPRAVEQDAPRHAVGAYRQIQPVPRLAQIAQTGTPANPVRIVARQRPHAVRVRRVEIRRLRKAGVHAGGVKPMLTRTPALALEPVADDRPVRPVKIVVEIRIRLHLSEEGQNVLEPPLVVAELRPVIEIVRQPAQEDLAIDRARAAGDFSAWDEHRLRDVVRLAGELPIVVVAHHNIGSGGVALLELFRKRIEIGIVGPRLQQQNGLRRVFRNPPRDRRPRRPRANDNDIVLHWETPPRSCRAESRIDLRTRPNTGARP